MAESVISAASIALIESELGKIHSKVNSLENDVEVVNNNVIAVGNNVNTVYDELQQLAKDFSDYVRQDILDKRLQQAETRIITIRQKLEHDFGHYESVRKSTTAILQANDLGIVRKESITGKAEDHMLSAPNYWLAPCLVALASWISDEQEIANKALAEALRRDDEKTSLLFALICRRSGRKDAAMLWTHRYLENQIAEDLNRNTIIVLDAFASGLLGADSEGLISKKLNEWLDVLASKPGFIEQQTAQWSEAIKMKNKPYDGTEYPYLQKYSSTWPRLKEIMQGAHLHAEILSYFIQIFEQRVSTDAIKVQLDNIMTSLVTDYDDEELPLRQDEKLEQFVIDCRGDEAQAKKKMQVEKSAFETHKDFTQLLTDAAMKPESTHSSPSTQKFAIALSKPWITNAYNDIVAQNRSKIPDVIEIHVDNFKAQTQDGENEMQILQNFNAFINNEKATALSKIFLTPFQKASPIIGAVLIVLGIILLFFAPALGIPAAIAGIFFIVNYFRKKKSVETQREQTEELYEDKRSNGINIIRATLAEVYDFRTEFVKIDSESGNVIDFLDQLTPEQYINKLAGSPRRINVAN